MNNKITQKEFDKIKSLISTHNNIIFRLEQFSKQVKEPQLKMEFQKLYASAVNHKKKLLSVLNTESNGQKQ